MPSHRTPLKAVDGTFPSRGSGGGTRGHGATGLTALFLVFGSFIFFSLSSHSHELRVVTRRPHTI